MIHSDKSHQDNDSVTNIIKLSLSLRYHQHHCSRIQYVDHSRSRIYTRKNVMNLSDLDLGIKCIEICEAKLVECIADCNYQSECISSCSRDVVDCNNACPCMDTPNSKCPNGCIGCTNDNRVQRTYAVHVS